jgi:hypothetical protein
LVFNETSVTDEITQKYSDVSNAMPAFTFEQLALQEASQDEDAVWDADMDDSTLYVFVELLSLPDDKPFFVIMPLTSSVCFDAKIFVQKNVILFKGIKEQIEKNISLLIVEKDKILNIIIHKKFAENKEFVDLFTNLENNVESLIKKFAALTNKYGLKKKYSDSENTLFILCHFFCA